MLAHQMKHVLIAAHFEGAVTVKKRKNTRHIGKNMLGWNLSWHFCVPYIPKRQQTSDLSYDMKPSAHEKHIE